MPEYLSQSGRPLLDNGSVVNFLHCCLGDKHFHATTLTVITEKKSRTNAVPAATNTLAVGASKTSNGTLE
jgi:hypothetical protein